VTLNASLTPALTALRSSSSPRCAGLLAGIAISAGILYAGFQALPQA
jgi:hypothetical protein